MKIFQAIRKNFASIGIVLNSVMKLRSFNTKLSVVTLMLVLALTSHGVYVSKYAETSAEYTQSIYVFSAVVLMALDLMIMFIQLEDFSKNIDGCERIANTREWCVLISNHKFVADLFFHKNLALKYSTSGPIFNKTNQTVEKISEILFFIMVKVTPACGLLPWLIYSFFIYFTAESPESNAFTLPSPMW